MTMNFHLRRFHVDVRNPETGETFTNCIVFEKSQLQAAQLVGQSSKELITRAYAEKGYEVVRIGRADKLSVPVNLDKLWRRASEEQEERAKWDFLYGG